MHKLSRKARLSSLTRAPVGRRSWCFWVLFCMIPVGFTGKSCWVSCGCTQAPRCILKQICNIFPFYLALMSTEELPVAPILDEWEPTTDALQEGYIYDWEVRNDCLVTMYGSAVAPFSRAMAHPFMEMCSATLCHFDWRGKDELAVHWTRPAPFWLLIHFW